MRYKKLLAIVLLSLSFCFVSGVGYGEVQEWMDKEEVSLMDIRLLEARIDYIMQRPNDFMDVVFYYDSTGIFGRELFAGDIDTKGKIMVQVVSFNAPYPIYLFSSFLLIPQIIFTLVEVAQFFSLSIEDRHDIRISVRCH